MSVSTLNAGGSEMSTKSIGFLGCGKISSAVARGYAGKDLDSKVNLIKSITSLPLTWEDMPFSSQVLVPKVGLEE